MRCNIESLPTMCKALGSPLTSQKRKVFDRVVVVALKRQRQVMSVKNRQNKTKVLITPQLQMILEYH